MGLKGRVGKAAPPFARATPRATVGVISATFGTVSYGAVSNFSPCVRDTVGIVSIKFWDSSDALARGVKAGWWCRPLPS